MVSSGGSDGIPSGFTPKCYFIGTTGAMIREARVAAWKIVFVATTARLLPLLH